MSIELPHYNFFISPTGVVYYNAGVIVNDGNALYQAYDAWVAEGNTAEEWSPEA